MKILIIWTIGCIVFLLICLYFAIRNERVFLFRVKIIELLYEDIRDLKLFNAIKGRLRCEASYNRMFYSIKPLRLKYWFTKEQVDYLKGGEHE